MAEDERWKVRAARPADLDLRELRPHERGTCRWCGESIYRVAKDGAVVLDRRRTWHEGREVHPDAAPEPQCVREYLAQAFDFRDAVGRRDDYTCQGCGLNVKEAQADHDRALRKLRKRHTRIIVNEYGVAWDYTMPGLERRRRELRDQETRFMRRRPEWQADHIVPLEDGGEHAIANGQVLCAPCHSVKTARENSERAARRRGDVPQDQLELA